MANSTPPNGLDQQSREFYLRAMSILDDSEMPYLVGGGYALAAHTGVVRQTKDLDLFMRRADSREALKILGAAGYRTEETWPHFLVKVISDPAFIDILDNSGNGLCAVDDEWFSNAPDGEVLGRTVKLCPAEEMIWSKAYVQERDRFDGADVAHLIRARGDQFDWPRLMRRFACTERVLLSHLLLFGFVYPSERHVVPEWVLEELWTRVRMEPEPTEPICRGTFLSQSQYAHDLCKGYLDARLRPRGPLTEAEIAEMQPA